MPCLRTIGMLCAICWLNASCGLLAQTAMAQEFFNAPKARIAHRQAIERGIELLRGSVDRYPQHRQCFSCHHQAVPLFAMRMAQGENPDEREFVWKNDSDSATHILELTNRSLESDLAKLSHGEELDGRGLTLGYAMWALDVSARDCDRTMDRLIDVALATQREDGRWRIHSHRPPASSSDRMATALVCASLLKHAPDHPKREEMANALCRARWWHLNAPLPSETEDIVGMLWCNYVFDEMDRRNVMTRATDRLPSGYTILDPDIWFLWKKSYLTTEEQARELMISVTQASFRSSDSLWRLQNPDGGWGQRFGDDSDAYATGLSLIVLANTDNDYEVGRVFGQDRYHRAIQWLIDNQLEDGSWYVSSRANPVQEFFDNGDPHDTDQFISIMATGWATAALCNARHGQPKPLQTDLTKP
jgi:N-acyl-D-amino-acid deacylase